MAVQILISYVLSIMFCNCTLLLAALNIILKHKNKYHDTVFDVILLFCDTLNIPTY